MYIIYSERHATVSFLHVRFIQNGKSFFIKHIQIAQLFETLQPVITFFIFTWFSGELGREAQDEFEDDGDRGSSLIQTPVEWQMRYFKAAV